MYQNTRIGLKKLMYYGSSSSGTNSDLHKLRSTVGYCLKKLILGNKISWEKAEEISLFMMSQNPMRSDRLYAILLKKFPELSTFS